MLFETVVMGQSKSVISEQIDQHQNIFNKGQRSYDKYIGNILMSETRLMCCFKCRQNSFIHISQVTSVIWLQMYVVILSHLCGMYRQSRSCGECRCAHYVGFFQFCDICCVIWVNDRKQCENGRIKMVVLLKLCVPVTVEFFHNISSVTACKCRQTL